MGEEEVVGSWCVEDGRLSDGGDRGEIEVVKLRGSPCRWLIARRRSAVRHSRILVL